MQVSPGVDGAPDAVKPNVVEVPAVSDPLYGAFVTVTAEPLALSTPFQSWLMLWPLARVHRTVHLLIAELPAVTVTVPW